MSGNFYKRLRDYLDKTAEEMRAQAKRGAVLPNRSDSGAVREANFSKFLKDHVPSNCIVNHGGYLFGFDGSESNQIDIIVSSPDQPVYRVRSDDHQIKVFTCVDGTIAVASIKSTLDKKQIHDSLESFAAIPAQQPVDYHRPSIFHKFPAYDRWPFKIIYAHAGISGQSAVEHINNFYAERSEIPYSRRVDLVHVLGEYAIVSTGPSGALVSDGRNLPRNTYFLTSGAIDAWAFTYAIRYMADIASSYKLLGFRFDHIVNKLGEEITLSEPSLINPSPSPPPPQTPSTSPS